ncbi:hypothetical protein GWK47_045739 [Chionoecetes opilio]|uniref:Uncharacterized protein n=1 Tax=Chionoecetes opilio TaxID=41210 RepID=A0A8J4Y719_CHIOP|nr:hypothetical protein GWK47_045739 [Chionoecetes opilio]
MHSGTNSWSRSKSPTQTTGKGARSEGEIALLLQKDRCRRPPNVSTRPAAYFAPKKIGLLHEVQNIGADGQCYVNGPRLWIQIVDQDEGVGDHHCTEAKYHLACWLGCGLAPVGSGTGKTYRMPVNQTRKPRAKSILLSCHLHRDNEVEEGNCSSRFASLRTCLRKCLADFGIRSEVTKFSFKEQILEALSY